MFLRARAEGSCEREREIVSLLSGHRRFPAVLKLRKIPKATILLFSFSARARAHARLYRLYASSLSLSLSYLVFFSSFSTSLGHISLVGISKLLVNTRLITGARDPRSRMTPLLRLRTRIEVRRVSEGSIVDRMDNSRSEKPRRRKRRWQREPCVRCDRCF